MNFLQGENHQLIEYDEEMVRKYIEEIKVYEDKFMVCFKANVKIEVKKINGVDVRWNLGSAFLLYEF